MKKAFSGGLILGTLMMSFMFVSLAHSQIDTTVKSLQDVTGEQIETVKKLIDVVVEFFVKYSFQVVGGLIVLALGWWIGGFVARKINAFLVQKKVDVTVAKFVGSFSKLIVMIFAVTVAMGKFGIEITPLIAGLSVVGLGLSLALQGPLSNYAAGLTLIFTKPFKVGDIVELVGQVGEITEIKIPRTEMKTVDGTTVMIPNNKIVGEIIENFSNWKKIQLSIGVGYKSDIDQAIQIVKDQISKDERVSKEKGILVGIIGFGDSSVDLKAIFFCKQDDYWQVQFDLNKNIFDGFNAANIEIPFPQRDVHLVREDAEKIRA